MASNVIVRWDAINKKIFSSPSFLLKAAPIVKNKFSKYFTPRKRELMEDFENSPITQEIEEGPKANNISNLMNGYGNLYSLLGFTRPERPITRLRNLLEKIEPDEPKINRSKMLWEFRVKIPSRAQIGEVTKVDWATVGWVDELEKGVDNVNRYMYEKDGIKYGDSKSTTGIQINNEIHPGATVVKAKYINEMLSNFRKRLREESARL